MQLLSDLRIAHREALPDAARHLGWSGTTAFAACDDGSVIALHADGAAEQMCHRLGEPVTAFAAAETLLAIGGMDGSALVVTRTSEASRFRLEATVRAASEAGGRAVFAAGESLYVTRDDTYDPAQLAIGPLTALAKVEGNLVLVGGVSGVAWFDTALFACDGRIELPTIVALATDPQRRFVAGGDLGGSVHILRPGSEDAAELNGYPDRVSMLGWLSTGAALCATADDELTVWRATDDGIKAPAPMRLVGHDRAITALAASPADDLVATGDAGGCICIWSPLRVDAPVAQLHVEGVVLAIAWNHTGRELVLSSSAGELLRCTVAPGSIA